MSVYKSILILAVFATIFASGITGQTPIQGCPFEDYRIVPDFEQIKAGEILGLEIVSKNGHKIEEDLKWTVSIGTIISGQGTSEIQVLTPADALAHKAPKLPPSDENGWILTGWIGGGRTVPLQITVEPIGNSSCNGMKLSKEVPIGKSSIEILTNYPANITELIIKENEAWSSCTNTEVRKAINVLVKATDLENDVLTFNYKVSAGKIIGTGPEVKWDLFGVAPGVYSITAGVNDGCGICGKTVTKTVTVGKCLLTTTNETGSPAVILNKF